MHRLRILSLVAILLVSGACKQDESEFTEKLVMYHLVCPAGIDGCYNDCGTSSGVSSGGEPTGDELRAFNSCTSKCDILCDTSFFLLAQ